METTTDPLVPDPPRCGNCSRAVYGEGICSCSLKLPPWMLVQVTPSRSFTPSHGDSTRKLRQVDPQRDVCDLWAK